MLSALYKPWIFSDPIYFSFTRVVVICCYIVMECIKTSYIFIFSRTTEPISSRSSTYRVFSLVCPDECTTRPFANWRLQKTLGKLMYSLTTCKNLTQNHQANSKFHTKLVQSILDNFSPSVLV